MKTFQELLDAVVQDGPPSLVLGNGFSQAWDAGIFNYANLLERANFGGRDAIIRALFDQIGTYDFEAVMARLVSAHLVLSVYGGNPGLLAEIEADQQHLKDALITAISDTHPDLPRRVDDAQYAAVRNFLSSFSQIFTVNYDLLLYWARNKSGLGADFASDDGFRAEHRWQEHGTHQNVHFVHGGLHIYERGLDVQKHVCTDFGLTIVEQVRGNLERGRFPLFVSEPSHQRKKARIMRSPYLRQCFGSLRELDGTVFIHGHSMDENDKHIFDQLKASSLRNIFVSLFGNEHSEANTRTKANAQAFLARAGRVVEFYQAETAPIWA